LDNIEDEEERKEAEKLLKRHGSAKTIIASKVKGEEPKEEPKKEETKKNISKNNKPRPKKIFKNQQKTLFQN